MPTMTEHTVTSTVKLSANDQAALQRQKRAQRVNNEQYFRVHPELRQMTSAFISALLADKPDDAAPVRRAVLHEPGARALARPLRLVAARFARAGGGAVRGGGSSTAR